MLPLPIPLPWFLCAHPLAFLNVEKDAETQKDDEDYSTVTYHFSCARCRKRGLKVQYLKLNGGVQAFLARSPATPSHPSPAPDQGEGR
jgi:hypothetical protein